MSNMSNVFSMSCPRGVTIFPSDDCLRMTLRHALAVMFGAVGIIAMHHLYPQGFDGVGAVGLFSTIMAVAAEDVSIGPIIHKSMMRSAGVCLGGLLGYICLYFPVVILTSAREACLVIILTAVVSLTQYATKGGWPRLSALIKQRKGGHMVIQFQIAFGTIFIGAWHGSEVSVMVAVTRTLAIVYGCMCLLAASLIALPQTSLMASCSELASCLRTGGKLAVTVCSDRTNGVLLEPYDHLAKGFSALKTDDHMKLMDSIDIKLSRGKAFQRIFTDPYDGNVTQSNPYIHFCFWNLRGYQDCPSN
jgi:hypothetical protein